MITMEEKEIIELIKEAVQCFRLNDVPGYFKRMEQARAAIDAGIGQQEAATGAETMQKAAIGAEAMQKAAIGAEAMQKAAIGMETMQKATIGAETAHCAAYGEWLLASVPQHSFQLDRICEIYREAARHLNGTSRVLPHNAPLFWDYYNVFAICNIAPGHAEENAKKLEEAVRLHFLLTGGGRGTDNCYRAQLAYYRGNLKEARNLGKEAFELARDSGQELVALCAADMLSQIAIHELDKSLWDYAHSHIRRMASGGSAISRVCREQAQVCLAIAELSLGLLHNVPEWIQSGEFCAVSAPWGYRVMNDRFSHSVLPNVLLAQIQYASYKNDPLRALNLADMTQNTYGIRNVVTDAYLDFFRTGCYLQLGDTVSAGFFLSRAVELIAVDGLWLIAAVFAPAYGNLLREAAKPYKEGMEQIGRIGVDFWEKLVPIREDMSRDAPRGFTRRQSEVISLLLLGRTNAKIAEELSISVATVKRYVEEIFARLDISRRGELAEALKGYSALETAFWVNGMSGKTEKMP